MPAATRSGGRAGDGDGGDAFATAFGDVGNPEEVMQSRSHHANKLSEEEDALAVILPQQTRGQDGNMYVRMPHPRELIAAQQQGKFIQQLEDQLEEQDPAAVAEDDAFFECGFEDGDSANSARESLVDGDAFFDCLYNEQIALDDYYVVDYDVFAAATNAEELLQEEEEFFGGDRKDKLMVYLQEAKRTLLQNVIHMDEMRDQIVGTGTRCSYNDDNWHFVQWCIIHKPTWVTVYCCLQVTSNLESAEGMRTRKRKKRIKDRFKVLLNEAAQTPIMNLD
jgi:hypothetical protein